MSKPRVKKQTTDFNKGGISARDLLRNNLLGQKVNFQSELVTLKNGDQVEVRQASIKQRSELRARCTSIDEEEGLMFNLFEFLVWAVILHTYVPGTNELVFEEGDYEALVSRPVGGFMDELSPVASRMMNAGTPDEEQVSEAKKC